MTSSHPATNIRVNLFGALNAWCGCPPTLMLSASSLRSLLDEIEQRYPALHRSICDETGAVRRHVNLFVNSDHVRDRDGLDTPLAAGDVVTILPALSGG